MEKIKIFPTSQARGSLPLPLLSIVGQHRNMKISLLTFIIVIAVILAITFAITFIDERRIQKKYDMYIREREPLSDNEFYDPYFKEQGIPEEILTKVRQIFAENLGIEFTSRLKNSDDLSEELSFIWKFDSLADVEIIMALEEEFGIEIRDEEPANMRSIQDTVVYVWSKIKELPNQPSEVVRQRKN